MDSIFVWILLIAIVAFVIYYFTQRGSSTGGKAVRATQQPYLNKDQLKEDIRSTQTSRIVDAVQILDELGSTSSNYRHYCELVGTSMTEGGVTAPYSKRACAYYDLRCYRIENREGRDIETLVAQEKSVERFSFSDGTGPSVYVDLASFGANSILINATNRVEGPNSDLAKAISGAAGTSAVTGAMACAAQAVRKAGNLLAGGVRDVAAGAAYGFARAFGRTPALAGAGGGSLAMPSPEARNVLFAGPGGRPGGPGGRPGGMGMGMGMGGRPGGSYGSVPHSVDVFLGGAGAPRSGNFSPYGGPHYRGNSSADALGTLLDVGLGMLVGSLASTAASTTQQQTGPTTSFRGYRIVEDIVPLGSPIYALGEIYRHGQDVYIGRSLSESYSSSFFACKPEAEVLNHLG